jgi:tetratricopeptide (TPR) repeat protein
VIAEGPIPADEGIRQLEQMLHQAGRFRRMEIAVLSNIADLEAMLGRFEVARGHIARAKAIARDLGDQVRTGAVLRNAAAIEFLAGDLVAAEAEARAGYELLESIGDLGHLASVAPDLALIVYALGRIDEAYELSKASERITIEGDVDAEVRWRQVQARTLARRGRHEEATALAEEAVRLAAATDFLDLHALALNALAEVLQLEGRNAGAAAAAREEIELHRRKGNVVAEAQTAAFLEELGRFD